MFYQCLCLVAILYLCKLCYDNLRPSEAQSAVTRTRALMPGRIINLSAKSNGTDGSIEVRWSHPLPHHGVTGYEICYQPSTWDVSKQKFILLALRRRCTLTRERDGIEPLKMYEIKVRPVMSDSSYKTEWASDTVYVDWYCRLPGCIMSRRTRGDSGDSYSSFCGGDHAKRFSSHYCLYPECLLKKAVPKHFCTEEHLQIATIQGICGFVNLDSHSKKYSALERNFSSSWCSKKGRLPKIVHIVEIVNPSLQQTFDKYVDSLPWFCRTVKEFYHGTELKCEILDYFEPCPNNNVCGVCGISKRGFDPNQISSSSWQRFGRGFYFAPNSSKSYEYPRPGRGGQTNDNHYRCILVCDIAPGYKYTLYENDTSLKGPPSGYHSVYGKSTWLWLWKSPDLNYDELVIFDPRAIRPHYILFCENTS